MEENVNHLLMPTVKVASLMTVEERRSRLRSIYKGNGDLEGFEISDSMEWAFGRPQAWEYTDHAFGYIVPNLLRSPDSVPIVDAGLIEPQVGLRGKKIDVTLDRLRVFEYPGGGEHEILVDFYAEHVVQNSTQSLHFNQKYRAKQGSGSGISGFPIFNSLAVGTRGVAFKGFTVNVSNRDDKKFLGFLDGDVFKTGLKLIGTINPAIPVVASYAQTIAETYAKRNENLPVQDFYLGLDFSNISTRAKLAEGSYIAIQVPLRGKFHWNDYVFVPQTGEILDKQGNAVEFNYMIFSVSEDIST